jgi:hypothetical protein
MEIQKNKFLIFLFILFCAIAAKSQVSDAGLWTSINLEKQISKKFSVSLSEEVRLNENISEVGSFFTDFGLNLKLNKFVRFGAYYRYSNKRRVDDSYSERHRYYFDVTLRGKYRFFTLSLRSRFQSQYDDNHSSPEGKTAENYSRNKLSLKYELNKKINFYTSYEIYTPLRSYDQVFKDNTRYSLGLEYSFNKMHSIDLSYMIQQESNVKNPWTDYVVCLGYNFGF